MNRPVVWLAITVTVAASAGWWANETLRRLEQYVLNAPPIHHGRLN